MNVLFHRVGNTVFIIDDVTSHRRNTEPHFEVHLLGKLFNLAYILFSSNGQLIPIKEDCIRFKGAVLD